MSETVRDVIAYAREFDLIPGALLERIEAALAREQSPQRRAFVEVFAHYWPIVWELNEGPNEEPLRDPWDSAFTAIDDAYRAMLAAEAK